MSRFFRHRCPSDLAESCSTTRVGRRTRPRGWAVVQLASMAAIAVLAASTGCAPKARSGPQPMDTVSLGNGVVLDLVRIPAGRFLMGSAEPNADPDERPCGEVFISHAFWIGQTEVTQAQWKMVMGEERGFFRGDPELPVEMVSWVEAKAFCRRLSERTGEHFRLPTEAEWEYACRAGTDTAYSFGDDASRLGEHAWTGSNSGSEAFDADAALAQAEASGDVQNYLASLIAHGCRTRKVATRRPNPWGLHDVHGNVLEWCEDWYERSAYIAFPTTDPLGPEGPGYRFRVVRGGSWGSDSSSCRSADRAGMAWAIRGESLGFRVVKGPPLETLKARQAEASAMLDLQLDWWENADRSYRGLSVGEATDRLADLERIVRLDPASSFARYLYEELFRLVHACPVGYEVVTVEPDPSEVTDPKARLLVTERGLPWRIRHVRTGIELLLCPSADFEVIYLSRTEVTRSQWRSVMGDEPSKVDDGSLPIERVSWVDCRRFLERAGDGLRLPTEVEWEHASRSDTDAPPPWQAGGAELLGVAWLKDNSGGSSRPVATRKPNAWGVHDFYGNVWEWCLPVTPSDDAAGVTGSPVVEVAPAARGGAWNVESGRFVGSQSPRLVPQGHVEGVGIRVALSP